MKKILSLVLVLMLALTACALSACTAKKDPVAAEPTAQADTAQAESDLAYVTGKGTLVVGMTLFAPMDYYEEGSDELIGFDADLARAVGEKLGLTVVFQEINWSSKEMELSALSIDCIWNGLTIDAERIANMSISKPYLNNTQAIVVRTADAETILADLTGKTVVAEQGSAGESQVTGTADVDETAEYVAKDFFAAATYLPVDSMAKALMEVKSGTADAAVVDSVCALGMVGESTDYSDLSVILTYNFGPEQYGIACRKGSDLTAAIDKAIDELAEDGTLLAIAEKYGLADVLVAR